jgi:hypothetical protein
MKDDNGPSFIPPPFPGPPVIHLPPAERFAFLAIALTLAAWLPSAVCAAPAAGLTLDSLKQAPSWGRGGRVSGTVFVPFSRHSYRIPVSSPSPSKRSRWAGVGGLPARPGRRRVDPRANPHTAPSTQRPLPNGRPPRTDRRTASAAAVCGPLTQAAHPAGQATGGSANAGRPRGPRARLLFFGMRNGPDTRPLGLWHSDPTQERQTWIKQ